MYLAEFIFCKFEDVEFMEGRVLIVGECIFSVGFGGSAADGEIEADFLQGVFAIAFVKLVLEHVLNELPA